MVSPGGPRELICPRCATRQYGAAASCGNCSKDLLPGRSPRFRYFAFLVSLLAVLSVFIIGIGAERIPLAQLGMVLAVGVVVAAVPIAIAPSSISSRYQRRARSQVHTNPELALQDLSRAMELDSENRALLIDRARVLRMLGRFWEAAADLRLYLERTHGEPASRVMRARLLLSYLEQAPGSRQPEVRRKAS